AFPFAALLAPALAAQDASTSDDPAAALAKQVELWQPTPDERRFDDIGWAKDIFEARRLGKEHNRPDLLFPHHRHLAVGRCGRPRNRTRPRPAPTTSCCTWWRATSTARPASTRRAGPSWA